MLPRLNHELLQQYIQSREKALRHGSVVHGDEDIIFRYGAVVGSQIDCFASLDRSMDYCRSLIDQHERQNRSVASGTTVLARKLDKSKGRFTRTWHAPEGGLWGCLILADNFLNHTLTLLPLALGVSGCEAIRESGADTATVRWVNDVLVEGKKCAGFLMEGYHSSLRKEKYLLIGFGINVNNEVFPRELGDTAISIKQITGETVDYDRFCLTFLAKLSWNIGLVCYEEQQEMINGCYSGSNGDHPLIEQWKKLTDTLGRRVLYGYDVMKKPQYEARTVDVANDGGLVMLLDSNHQIVEHSGEVRYINEK